MTEQVSYRQAHHDDLRSVAEIFMAAFPESVRHYAGRSLKPQVMRDVFAICLRGEPEAFFVAAENGRIAGYVFAPANLPRLIRFALWRGPLLSMGWRWMTGRYGIGLRPVLVAARNWIALLRQARDPELRTDARVLSVAVRPDFQGRGIGTQLVRIALEQLQKRGVPQVRLEARPGNRSAVHIYAKLGFEVKGSTRDTQGEWLIMLKDLRPHAEG